jgi:hypothetical protein
MSELLARLRVLRTGVVEWVDQDTGRVEVDLLGWRDRWAVFGAHSFNWGWVRRFGTRDCGCTFNPLTRRRVLTRMDCAAHGRPAWKRDSVWDDEMPQEWEDDEEWEQWR